jgi:DNA-binding NarL/FixJ family response regulator
MISQALALALSGHRNFTKSAFSASFDSAIRMIAETSPDVMVINISRDGRAAFDLTAKIRRKLANVRVLFMAGVVSDLSLHRLIALNASGVILKSDPLAMLIDAIQRAMQGERIYSPAIAQRLQRDPATGLVRLKNPSPIVAITERQLEVLRHLARGLSVKEIAAKMFVSAKTIDSHKYRMMKLLGVNDRVELSRLAIREGIIDP